MNKQEFSHPLLDAVCVASLVGIWPRYCEPKLLSTSYVTLKIKDLPAELDGLRILQFSDLHLNHYLSDQFLKKICVKMEKFSPDLTVFTGDFLCQSQFSKELGQRLQNFLCELPKARYGAFAVLGNHDYAEFVSVNQAGDYAIAAPSSSPFRKGMKRLISRTVLPKAMQRNVHDVCLHQELIELLARTPFRLLHNACATVPINGSALNVVGLGEYSLGRCDPATAFRLWDDRFQGIILAHNPDSAPLVADYPGSVILSGHTHGGQVNLPLIRNKFLVMENPRFKRGMLYIHNKWLYVNRGIGGLMPFRWFAMPELLCLTLVPA